MGSGLDLGSGHPGEEGDVGFRRTDQSSPGSGLGGGWDPERANFLLLMGFWVEGLGLF